MDTNQQRQADDQLRMLSQTFFVKNYRTKPDEIRKALGTGDNTLARRLAHTLKSSAGQIGKTRLQHIAADMEHLLRDGKTPAEEHVELLEAELNTVLRQLAPLLNETGDATKTLDTEQTLALFDKLESMLKNKNPQCLDLLDEIRAVPGSEALIHYVEEFDVKPAIATLSELRKKWMRDGESNKEESPAHCR